MSFLDQLSTQEKMRIIQEIVPGKQITLAHIIANPDPVLYQKLGLDPAIMASPMITTIVDACALGIYFLLAIQLLGL